MIENKQDLKNFASFICFIREMGNYETFEEFEQDLKTFKLMRDAIHKGLDPEGVINDRY